MFVWCSLLFVLGIFAFIDSIFNMGEIFRQVNSVMFMLISLGLLIRTTTKARAKKKENYERRIFDLECQVKGLENAREKLGSFYDEPYNSSCSRTLCLTAEMNGKLG